MEATARSDVRSRRAREAEVAEAASPLDRDGRAGLSTRSPDGARSVGALRASTSGAPAAASFAASPGVVPVLSESEPGSVSLPAPAGRPPASARVSTLPEWSERERAPERSVAPAEASASVSAPEGGLPGLLPVSRPSSAGVLGLPAACWDSALGADGCVSVCALSRGPEATSPPAFSCVRPGATSASARPISSTTTCRRVRRSSVQARAMLFTLSGSRRACAFLPNSEAGPQSPGCCGHEVGEPGNAAAGTLSIP